MRPERSATSQTGVATTRRLTLCAADLADQGAVLLDLDVGAEPLDVKVALCTRHGWFGIGGVCCEGERGNWRRGEGNLWWTKKRAWIVVEVRRRRGRRRKRGTKQK
jgi:hypothetical protein